MGGGSIFRVSLKACLENQVAPGPRTLPLAPSILNQTNAVLVGDFSACRRIILLPRLVLFLAEFPAGILGGVRSYALLCDLATFGSGIFQVGIPEPFLPSLLVVQVLLR